MPFYCSAFGCKNKDGKETRAKGISFHQFPSDKQRSDRWAVRLHRQGELTGTLWKPGNRAVVCSEHFLPSDFFWQWGRKLLKLDAEPTVFSFTEDVKRQKALADRSFPTATNEDVVIQGHSSVEIEALPEVYVTAGATVKSLSLSYIILCYE